MISGELGLGPRGVSPNTSLDLVRQHLCSLSLLPGGKTAHLPTCPHFRVPMPNPAVSMRDGRFQGPSLPGLRRGSNDKHTPHKSTHLASTSWLPASVPQLKLLEGPVLWAVG